MYSQSTVTRGIRPVWEEWSSPVFPKVSVSLDKRFVVAEEVWLFQGQVPVIRRYEQEAWKAFTTNPWQFFAVLDCTPDKVFGFTLDSSLLTASLQVVPFPVYLDRLTKKRQGKYFYHEDRGQIVLKVHRSGTTEADRQADYNYIASFRVKAPPKQETLAGQDTEGLIPPKDEPLYCSRITVSKMTSPFNVNLADVISCYGEEPKASSVGDGLPDDHWIRARVDSRFDAPPMPFRMGLKDLRSTIVRDKAREAIQQAIRASTACGTSKSIDPDALVQNCLVALFGYFTDTGLGEDAWENPPESTPPDRDMLASIFGGVPEELIGVWKERERQIYGEGFIPEGDDLYLDGELARAAACYATPWGHRQYQYRHADRDVKSIPAGWPWPDTWWKPGRPQFIKERLRDLEKAGALILAEMARLYRKLDNFNTSKEK